MALQWFINKLITGGPAFAGCLYIMKLYNIITLYDFHFFQPCRCILEWHTLKTLPTTEHVVLNCYLVVPYNVYIYILFDIIILIYWFINLCIYVYFSLASGFVFEEETEMRIGYLQIPCFMILTDYSSIGQNK